MPPTKGDTTIGGFWITKQPLQAKRLIGFIPQEMAPINHTAPKLALFGELYGLRGKELQ